MTTMFGPYRLDGLIGQGGMGQVYRAYDTGQKRSVALKRLLPDLAGDKEYTGRFRREQELAARLNEPHVIPIHHYGEIDGRLYIDMRLVEGRDLAQTLAQDGPMAPVRVVNVVIQVAAALDAAHADGLVHRDVKPSNVLLSSSANFGDMDFIYLVDFGIARPVRNSGKTITKAGHTVGSIDYMAPERFGSDDIDHRVDVYSLTCVLHEALTGTKPFPAESMHAAMHAHMNLPPPRPSHAHPGVPAGFDDVVARGMAKDPDDRYDSVRHLIEAARSVLAPTAAPSVTDPPATGNGRPVRSDPSAGTSGTTWSGWATPLALSSPPPARAAEVPAPRAPPAAESGGPLAANAAASAYFGRPPTPSHPAARPPPPKPADPPTPADPPNKGGWPGRPAQPPATPQLRAPGPPEPPNALPSWLQGRQSGVHQVGGGHITIGRAPDCTVVVDDLLVSEHHAELRRGGSGWRIVDLGSWGGTFLNGRRVTDAPIEQYDVIGVGHAMLRLVGDQLVEYTDTGDIGFRATDLVVTRAGRKLVDGVSFHLEERSVLAVLGPSGAGKSTLLGALTGQRPADMGQVEYDDRDLYANYDELRHRIGLVPQEDILHRQLTVRRALSYAAELRFPADTPAVERERRIDEVLAELSLTAHADQRITTLSGGQKKRTSVALELLTRPSLLFLDEPTSGLDPGMDKSVMQTLRTLADEGRTVVVVTHSVLHLDSCDRLLVLAPGGRVAYLGPPSEVLAYFGEKDLSDVFQVLEKRKGEDWGRRFRESPYAARFLQPGHRNTPRPVPAAGRALAPPIRQQSTWTQFGVLCRRYLAVITADRPYAIFLAALPFVLAIFAQLMPGAAGLSVTAQARDPNPSGSPQQLLLVMVVAAAFMGFATAFRELEKERAIFQREQAIGLSVPAYLWSKLAILGSIAVLQAVVLGLLSTAGAPLPPSPVLLGDGLVEIVVALVAVTVTMTALGLLVSALITNADRGMPVLVIVLMLQLVLCGMLFPVHGEPLLEQLSWLVPARWAFAMGASTSGFRPVSGTLDPLWKASADVWLFDLVVLVLLALMFAVTTQVRLHRTRPGRR